MRIFLALFLIWLIAKGRLDAYLSLVSGEGSLWKTDTDTDADTDADTESEA